jgi:hypothetical protein
VQSAECRVQNGGESSLCTLHSAFCACPWPLTGGEKKEHGGVPSSSQLSPPCSKPTPLPEARLRLKPRSQVDNVKSGRACGRRGGTIGNCRTEHSVRRPRDRNPDSLLGLWLAGTISGGVSRSERERHLALAGKNQRNTEQQCHGPATERRAASVASQLRLQKFERPVGANSASWNVRPPIASFSFRLVLVRIVSATWLQLDEVVPFDAQ